MDEIINHEEPSESKKSAPTIVSIICKIHSSPFSFFCETCIEPVCKLCTLVGPHNNQVTNILFF